MKIPNPEIQDKILDLLPDDAKDALDTMASLTANMILSIDDANINNYITVLRKHLASLEGT